MFLLKKNRKSQSQAAKYVIAFCDTKDISTKFGEYDKEVFDSYEDAKHRILSKVNGWGYAVKFMDGNAAQIDGGWLVIEEKIAENIKDKKQTRNLCTL